MSDVNFIDIDGEEYHIASGASAVVDGNNLIINNGNAINTEIHLTNFEYSEEERVVGCWIDGKPIYERVIILENNFTGEKSIDSETPYDTLIYSTVLALNGNNLGRAMNGMINTTVNDRMIVYIDKNALWIIIGKNYSNCSYKYVLVQYTKTTDLPNSFKPSMLNIKSIVPQHNYSTEEKIVGTWIDGKPIYEKTFLFSSQITASGNTWIATNIDNTNIKKIINSFGLSISNVFPIAMSIGNANDGLQFMHFRNTSIYIDGLIYQYTKN